MARMKSNLIIKQKDNDGNEFPLIGYGITWSYGQKRYDMDMVIKAAQKYGFESVFQHGQNKIKVVVRALQEAKKQNLLSEVSKYSDRIEYQMTEKVLSEMPNGEKYHEFIMKEKITHWFGIDKVICGNPDTQVLVDEFIKICGTSFVNCDITRYTQAIFNETGIIPLRSRGGFYFVPGCYGTLVENVKKMFEEIDPKSEFSILEIPDLKYAKTSVATSFESSMADKLKVIKEKIEILKAGGKELSQRRFKNMIEEIATWSKDIEMYSDLTEYTLQDCKDIKIEAEKIVTSYLMDSNNLFKPTV